MHRDPEGSRQEFAFALMHHSFASLKPNQTYCQLVQKRLAELPDKVPSSSSAESSSGSPGSSPRSCCSSARTEISLSPQVDRTAGDKDESTSTPPEHNYVVISKAPVASTGDEPTTKVDETKQDMMDESVTVAKDDSSASEALVPQADQAPTTGSDEVHRHDDVDMTEAHCKA
jgi:hypothetical protein